MTVSEILLTIQLIIIATLILLIRHREKTR